MRTGWGRGIDEEQEGTVKKKKAETLALSWQSPLPWRGRCVFTCSSSQVEKPRPVAFTRAVQEHSWLPGWQRACYPPTPSSACASSFHIPFSHTPSICILFASTSPLRFSWPPCNKKTSSTFFYFSCKDTGEDKQHSQQPRWCLRQAKASWSWKSNALPSNQIRCSRRAWNVLLVTNVSPQSQNKEMSSDNLMESVNQQVSNGNTHRRGWAAGLTEYAG